MSLKLLARAGIFAGAALLALGSAAAAPTLFQWEDYVDEPFLAQYEREFKEKPNVAMFADEDEAFAKMRAGFKPDVMAVCYYEYPRWQEAGLLQPIDTTKLKNWNKLSPSLRSLPGISAGENKVWFVPHYWGNTSITIRTDLAPEYAKSQSWNILFDPKYKGRVAVLDGVDDTVPFIAKMMGIDAYNMNAAQWKQVQDKLRALVKQVRFVSSDNTTLTQGLASGEIVAAMSWRVIYSTLKEQKKPVAYLNPPGGMFTYVCGLALNKNTKDIARATALLDSSLSDEASLYMINTTGDGPANGAVMQKVPQATLDKIGITRDVDAFLKSGTFQRRLKNKDQIVNSWTEIRAGL